jgi:hypothetical protein
MQQSLRGDLFAAWTAAWGGTIYRMELVHPLSQSLDKATYATYVKQTFATRTDIDIKFARAGISLEGNSI